MNNQNKDMYQERIHKLGRISTLIMIIALLGVPLAITLIFQIKIDIGRTITAFLSAFMIFGVVGFIEFVSYAPILGAGGQYLSFITGNITNLKMPAAISGIKLAGLEPGTKEADILSTISIAISSIVTTGIIVLGLVFIGPLLPVLESPTFAPAFANMMPALLGALATPMLLKDIKNASGPCIIAALLTIAVGYTTVAGMQSLLMPVFLGIAIGWKFLLIKIDAKKKIENK